MLTSTVLLILFLVATFAFLGLRFYNGIQNPMEMMEVIMVEIEGFMVVAALLGLQELCASRHEVATYSLMLR